uniref:Interleukin-21 n=1 Tax=Spermophilus dauricus TaxID=99837 RepID=A0A8C9NYF2_SPEDA
MSLALFCLLRNGPAPIGWANLKYCSRLCDWFVGLESYPNLPEDVNRILEKPRIALGRIGIFEYHCDDFPNVCANRCKLVLFQGRCEQSALLCFQKFAGQLKPPNTGDNGTRISIFIKNLKRRVPSTNASRKQELIPTCPSCDSYEKKPPKEFLERLKSLLQKVSSLNHPAAVLGLYPDCVWVRALYLLTS